MAHEHDMRIARLEASLDTFREEFRAERANAQSREQTISLKLDALSEKMSAAGRTNWAPIGLAATVIIAGIGFASAIASWSYNGLKAQVDAHERMEGHPGGQAANAAQDASLAYLTAQVNGLQAALTNAQGSRFTREDGQDLKARLDALEKRDRGS